MKRITFALAGFALLMLPSAGHPEFKGTLNRVQPFSVEIDNSANTVPAAVTIFYLGKGLDFDVHTVPAGVVGNFIVDSVSKGTSRIIVQVDPSPNPFFIVPVRVVQGGNAFANPGVGDVRLVFDVV